MSNALLQEEGTLAETPTASAEKKVRVQLDFEQADMRIINDLVAELDLGTRAELFRSGLRALRWMVQKKKQDCSVLAITQDGRYLEPEFDFLDRLHSVTPARAPVHKPIERLSDPDYLKEKAHA